MTNGRKTNQNRLCKSFAMKVFSTREINAEVIAALLFVIHIQNFLLFDFPLSLFWLFIFNDISFFKHFHSSLQSVLCLDSSFDRIQSFDDDDEDEDDDDDDDDDDDHDGDDDND